MPNGSVDTNGERADTHETTNGHVATDDSETANEHVQHDGDNTAATTKGSRANEEVRTTTGKTTATKEADDTAENTDAVKVDGPGPKPVSEVAKEHGGDAGSAGSGSNKETSDSNGAADAEEEDEDGPQKVSHGEGTGEKYIKSSGVQADGGDFDAAKAGAGREAYRELFPVFCFPASR